MSWVELSFGWPAQEGANIDIWTKPIDDKCSGDGDGAGGMLDFLKYKTNERDFLRPASF